MNDLTSRLDALLSGLGDTADKVADSLKAKAIQGVRNTVRILNPIVRFLQDALHESGVGLDMVTPGNLRARAPDGTISNTLLPQPVLDFLARFDQGDYPHLEMVPKPPT
jgi:hypothetical protein